MYDLNAPAPEPLEETGSRRGDPLVGRTFNGRFRIEARLAKGGMGKVYRAQQVPLGRAVALKVLNVAVAPEHLDAFHKRFFMEAATAARLSHPHTVTIFDYGRSDDGIYYIAMEYLDGQSLRQLLHKQAPLPPRRAVTIAIQIARAVREAHGLGFMHRDLKPANVVLLEDDDGRDFAKVLDFGLAKSADSASDLTRTGQFLGSPGYMAPEQIRGAPLDARCDIYALGAMLFEMLTGHVPFARKGPMDTLMAHVHEVVPRFDEVNTDLVLPRELEAVVQQCLAKKPQDRPQDMSMLMTLLREAVAHLPQEAGALRAVALDEYEASGWAVVSPTGALRIQLGDDVHGPADAPADDALTLLGFDAPQIDAAGPATIWAMPERARTDAPTLYGAAIASASMSADPDLPTLYFVPPPPAPAPARTVIATSPVALRMAANDTKPSKPAQKRLTQRWRAALLGVVALLYAEPHLGGSSNAALSVTMHLQTIPAGAMVWRGDKLLCKQTPCDVVWQRQGKDPAPALRFFADGYDEYFTNRYAGHVGNTFTVALTPSDAAP